MPYAQVKSWELQENQLTFFLRETTTESFYLFKETVPFAVKQETNLQLSILSEPTHQTRFLLESKGVFCFVLFCFTVVSSWVPPRLA
jgi:penicillin-binding protein-related factor A (putative recombinase)